MPAPLVVATDLDGTLLRSDGTLSDRSRRALLAAEAQGVHVLFVTARPPRWLAGLADAIGGHGHVICLNGACVYEVGSGAVSQVHGFDDAILDALVTDLRSAVPGVAIGLEGPYGPELDPHFAVGADAGQLDDHGRAEALVTRLVGQPVGKLLARVDGQEDGAFFERVEAVVGDRATLAFSGAAGLAEMTAPGVTKAAALERWCASYGVLPHEVWAFGDMPNDLPMLSWAGRSVAVANAHPDVLAAATHRTSSNDDDGVAEMIETFLG